MNKNSTRYSIKKRSLSSYEIEQIIEYIKADPNFSAYSRRAWAKCNQIFIVENAKGKLIGVLMNDDFSRKWTEIAIVYILEPYRNSGFGTLLLKTAIEDLQQRKRNIFIMARNPQMVALMHKYGFDVKNHLSEYTQLNKKEHFLLEIYYHLRWKLNMYRIEEIRRKAKVFGVQKKFMYGIIKLENSVEMLPNKD